MKISKKVREEAALLSAIAASDDGWPIVSRWVDARESIGASLEASKLASRAWIYAYDNGPSRGTTVDAEAESLLRTGWSPP